MVFVRVGFLLLSIFAFLSNGFIASAQGEPIRITADLTESSRRLFHAEIDLPVHAGPATFTSPLWIPGSHSPNGPIGSITGVVFTANGKVLPWHRDDVALAEFHVEVPAGLRSIHAHVDALVASRATRQMAMLEWETLMLYPAHVPVKEIEIEPAVTFPSGWGVGTALAKLGAVGTPRCALAEQADHLPPADAVTIQYAQTTVEQLEDSPVLAGRYFREYRIAPDVKPEHFLDVAGDEATDAEIRPEVLRAMDKVVREARLEYGSFHYREYRFLVTRSDYAGGYGGVEHAQSTDIGVQKSALSDEAHQLADADLFAHEFTHSWNGKYRRPVGIYQTDFATPVQAKLLWIYEGMTQYLGDVLATRAGLKSPERFREMLALTAADLDHQSGRDWRSTEDTAVAVSLMRGGGSGWANWRRGKAYYPEGELLWLDADMLIRSLTANRRSLDDFERLFLGKGGDTGPMILPYSLDEVIHDLNEVAPYDWPDFFRDRVAKVQAHADLDGIVRGGYTLIYTDHPSTAEQILSDPDSSLYVGEDYWYSLGLRVDTGGTLMDVRWGSPADKAKLAPKQKLLTVNGAPYSAAGLHSAITAATHDRKPLQLTLRQDGEKISADLDYHDGERFPDLKRSPSEGAYLEMITKPRSE
jgi:predicted metalloprotease with PDZ domain